MHGVGLFPLKLREPSHRENPVCCRVKHFFCVSAWGWNCLISKKIGKLTEKVSALIRICLFFFLCDIIFVFSWLCLASFSVSQGLSLASVYGNQAFSCTIAFCPFIRLLPVLAPQVTQLGHARFRTTVQVLWSSGLLISATAPCCCEPVRTAEGAVSHSGIKPTLRQHEAVYDPVQWAQYGEIGKNKIKY